MAAVVIEVVLEEEEVLKEEVLEVGVLKGEVVEEGVLEEEDAAGVVTGGVIAEEAIEEGSVEVESGLTTFAKLRVLKVGFSLRKINLACGLETKDLACTAKTSASNLYS